MVENPNQLAVELKRLVALTVNVPAVCEISAVGPLTEARRRVYWALAWFTSAPI